jgi:CRISPR-associated protein (Cas_Csd1)
MGMIGPSGGAPDRRGDADRRQDAAGGEPLPFSHDSHFSVSAQGAPGYRLHAIDEIIVIGGNGRIVGVESPGFIAGERRRKGAMPVPVATLSKGCVPIRFLWGSARSVLGLSGGSMEDHLKYKSLHHRALEGVGDMALQAFLRFLEQQTPSAAGDLPAIAERPGCKLAFRFQYDEHYLHERHAAQLAWKRFLSEALPRGDLTALR